MSLYIPSKYSHSFLQQVTSLTWDFSSSSYFSSGCSSYFFDLTSILRASFSSAESWSSFTDFFLLFSLFGLTLVLHISISISSDPYPLPGSRFSSNSFYSCFYFFGGLRSILRVPYSLTLS